MTTIDLGTIERTGVDPAARQVSFLLGGAQEGTELRAGFGELASLISAMFKACEHAAKNTPDVPDLPNLASAATIVIHPSQLDVRRTPKAAGELHFQVGTARLSIRLDSRAMDYLTQLLNSRR